MVDLSREGQMMVAELESAEKRLLLGHGNPMVCHDHCDELCYVGASQGMPWLCKTLKSQYSSIVRKPWKMMDHPREYVTKKGMLEPGG
jgi:hypothetical protein